MADDRLREFERRFRETKSAADEVVWLKASLRAGSIRIVRLQLAAFLNHPPARAALQLRKTAQPLLEPPLASTLPALSRWEPHDAVRVAIGAARASEHGEQAALDVLERVERWAVNPEGGESLHLPSSLRQALAELSRRENVVRAAVHAFQSAVCLASPEWGADAAVGQAVEAAVAASKAVGEETVLESIQADVVPWVLGYGDPVRMRVGKRGEVELGPEDLGRG